MIHSHPLESEPKFDSMPPSKNDQVCSPACGVAIGVCIPLGLLCGFFLRLKLKRGPPPPTNQAFADVKVVDQPVQPAGGA